MLRSRIKYVNFLTIIYLTKFKNLVIKNVKHKARIIYEISRVYSIGLLKNKPLNRFLGQTCEKST